MSSRRKFIRNSVLGSAAALSKVNIAAAAAQFPAANGPIVISTWDFGKAANAAAWEILQKGGTALDAVEAGVRVPEGDPANPWVGYGGYPDRDGRVTLDSCIMDDKYNCGSVMCLEYIKHPISVARMVMEKTPHIILVGDGALQFALANGFKKENLLTPSSEKAWKEWMIKAKYQPMINQENSTSATKDTLPGGSQNHDTIGMLALDGKANLSGACTTSGLQFKMHGRVGDSPVIGAGLYVDNEVGAATATGVGEEMIRIVGSHTIVELMRHGVSPEEACKQAIQRIIKCNPAKAKDMQCCFIALNKKGQYGAYALQKEFTYSVRDGKNEQVLTSKSIYS